MFFEHLFGYKTAKIEFSANELNVANDLNVANEVANTYDSLQFN